MEDKTRTPFHQKNPFLVPTDDGKRIEEHFGRASFGDERISIAHMVAPSGWSEPAQTPEFSEYTLVSRGRKKVELPDGAIVLSAGESLLVPAGVRVRYSNPFDEETEYWSVCTPAFDPDAVHREET